MSETKQAYSVADRAWQIVAGCTPNIACQPRCWATRVVNRLAQSPDPKIAEFHRGLVELRGRDVADPFFDATAPERDRTLRWTGKVRLNEAHLLDPLRRRKPTAYAVGFHGDLFRLPFEQIDRVFAIEALTPWHRYLHLSKAVEQMQDYFAAAVGRDGKWIARAADQIAWLINRTEPGPLPMHLLHHRWGDVEAMSADLRRGENWPLPNVWLGTSASNQPEADARITVLLQVPAVHRFVFLEPLIGALDVTRYLIPAGKPGYCFDIDGGWWHKPGLCASCRPGLSWIIVGGESGSGARPMHPDWARSLRDQCAAAGVSFLFKQWGEWAPVAQIGFGGREHLPTHTFSRGDGTGTMMIRVGKKTAGRILDGREHNEIPEALCLS